MRTRQKGSLTVEATLVFPIYIMAILTIISLLNIYYTHAIVQQALNNTALQIAQCSYIVDKAGLIDTFDWTNSSVKKMDTLKTTANETMEAVKSTMESFSGGFTIETMGNIIGNAQTLGDKVKALSEQIKALEKDDWVALVVNIVLDGSGDKLTEVMVNCYLEDMHLNRDNIIDMDFSMSKFYYNSNHDITLVVTYTYKNPFVIKFFDEVDILQTTTVHPWIGK